MKTMINIKADREVKIKAQKVAADLGMPLSTVINAYLREFIRTKSVHFSLIPLGTPEGVLKPHVKRRYARIHKDIVEGKNLVGPFEDAKEVMRYLNS
jgi:addiction module RelB/DinJ family antitoxin